MCVCVCFFLSLGIGRHKYSRAFIIDNALFVERAQVQPQVSPHALPSPGKHAEDNLHSSGALLLGEATYAQVEMR